MIFFQESHHFLQKKKRNKNANDDNAKDEVMQLALTSQLRTTNGSK